MGTNRNFCAALFLLLLCTLSTFAGPRSLEQVRQIAMNFVRSQQVFKGTAPALTFATTPEAKDRNGIASQPAYHVLNIETGGYVIVSSDDQFKAILGYSPEGTFDTATLPDGLSYWLQFLSEEMAAAQTAVPMADPQAVASTALTDVEPLLQSHWVQSYPFNAQVPIAYTSPYQQMNEQYQGHASTGCVALGMGQVMNYWKYPSKGQGGTHKNTSNKGTDGKDTIISVNYSQQTYDWDLIQDDYGLYIGGDGDPQSYANYRQADYTDEQAQEVAKLCYHAGVAVDMVWNSDRVGGSSAPNGKALSALINYFGYNKYAYVQQRDPISPGTLRRLLHSELQAGRPVPYGGYSSTSGARTGHFFIIDGYQASTDNYHINWGWQGQYNGYYALSALTPGAGIGYGMGDYSYCQSAIVGIQPTELAYEYAPAISVQTFSMEQTTVNRSTYAIVNCHNIINDDPKFKGEIGVAIYATNGKLEAEKFDSYDNFTVGTSSIKFQMYTPYLNNFIPVGEHTMRVEMKTADGKRYPMHAAYGNAESWKVVVKSGNPGTVTFSEIVPTIPNSITIVPADKTIRQTEYYTLDGTRVNTPTTGITIRRNTYTDGSIQTEKIFRR